MDPWFVIQLRLPAPLEDPACALLQETGSAGWEVREAGTGEVEVLAYVSGPLEDELLAQLAGRLAAMADALGTTRPAPPVARPVPSEDWETEWRRHCTIERPLPGLVIRPS